MALEFASRMKPVQSNPNLDSDGNDLINGAASPILPGYVFVEEVACSFSTATPGKRAAGAVYVGTGGSVAVLPTNKTLNSANLMVFTNVPNGSFLPVAANKIIFTPFNYVALDQELKTLINANNFSISLSNEKNEKFIANWYRVINNVKTQIGRVQLAITFGVDATQNIYAVRLSAGYDWNKGGVKTNSFFNLDFAESGDTLEIPAGEYAGLMSADVVFTLTSNEIKRMPGTTATDLIAYQ